tara:strand:+ start:3955 stop:4842 length:888 start_codon:yes stop_codon:yes gene_type:complete
MKKFIILIPLFNDWKSVTKLIDGIDSQILNWDAETSIIIVNDASTEEKLGLTSNYKKIKSIKILNMKKNRGHQRCIASGLKYIYEKEDFDRVIVMDADGEDRPEELNEFFIKSKKYPNMTITGNRYKRSEGFIFRFLYEIHKLLTLIFTGKLIKFGNFTCLPKEHVKKLFERSDLWNSYSSSVVRSIKDRTFIQSMRGSRYVLPSKMNFAALFFHSLTIISVFRNIVIFRSIIFLLFFLFLISQSFFILPILSILFLILFVIVILKISMRANMEEFSKSLENIASIDSLNSSNSR